MTTRENKLSMEVPSHLRASVYADSVHVAVREHDAFLDFSQTSPNREAAEGDPENIKLMVARVVMPTAGVKMLRDLLQQVLDSIEN